MKYYAVKANEGNKIFESWDDAKEYIKISTGVKHKSFTKIEEAKAFLEDRVYKDEVVGIKAYIDGSYNKDTLEYSFGGVLIADNKVYRFKKKYKSDEFSTYRNVAGEIKGAGYIINHSINLGIKELHLYYDYIGIEKWWNLEWKANSLIGKLYQDFANNNRDKINIIFHKIKSHTNDYYNDLADSLAKEALNIK